MPTYTLIDGPCDGERRTFSHPLADNAQIQCGGASYEFNKGNPGVLIFLDVGASAGGGAPVAARAHNGYHDLQRAVNVTMVGATARAAEIRHRALHRLARRRG